MRIFRGWVVVGGAMVAHGFSAQMFIASSYTLLAAAIASSLGWSQGDLALGVSVYLFGVLLGYPLAGVLADRFGSLRTGIAGLVMIASHMYGLSKVDAPWKLQVLMFTMGLFAQCSYTPTYLRAISLWFVKKRGLAFGIACAGMGLGAILYPLGVERLIANVGWASTLVTLAGLLLFVCLPIIVLTIRDDPRRLGQRAYGDDGSDRGPSEAEVAGHGGVLEGMHFSEIIRTADFWLLASVFMVTAIAQYAVVTNAVQILRETAGLNLAQVAKTQAVLGLSMLIGRVVGGVFLDYLDARLMGAFMNLAIAAGILGYAMASGMGLVVISGFLIGFATGGEGDVLPFMVARYFGRRAFGKAYGAVGAMFAAGAAIGPIAYTFLVGAMGGVRPALIVLAAMAAAISINFALIGRRRQMRSLAQSCA